MRINANRIEYVRDSPPKFAPSVKGWKYATVAVQGDGVTTMRGYLRRETPFPLTVARRRGGGMRWAPATDEETSLALSLLGHKSGAVCPMAIATPSFLPRLGDLFRVYEATDGSGALSLHANGLHFRASMMRSSPLPDPTRPPISAATEIPKPFGSIFFTREGLRRASDHGMGEHLNTTCECTTESCYNDDAVFRVTSL